MEQVGSEPSTSNRKKFSKQELIDLIKSESKCITLSNPATHDRSSKYLSLFKHVFVNNVQQDFLICTDCQTFITYKSQTGTGGLKKHMDACITRTAAKDQTTLDEFLVSASTSHSSSRHGRSGDKFSLPKHLRRSLNRAFVEFAALDCRSFETIAGTGFIRLIKEVFRTGLSMRTTSMNIDLLIPSTKTVWLIFLTQLRLSIYF